ncbi:unnamed protein product [Mytilus edulis]|uniref:Chitin-binding type-2 domain-containing protein n=1 Tax=Mytilus edulis TaxID=6550 RepID=A0A8S3T481_MYTED|nr:unnamed protein product [Mytilus edulis]
MHHNIKEEVNELDDVGIYYEIADSTKRRTSGQSDVKCYDQQEYVLRPADDYCLTQDKETNKPSANSPCSACRIIILAAIITILLIGLCCAAYFLWIRNINENEKTDTLNNTQHSITSTPTDILTNPASTLTTSTDHVLSTTKESSLSEAPSSTTETYYDFCEQNLNGTITNKYHHPTTCHRYVTCEDRAPSVQACPGNICFSLEKDYCDYCSHVKTCP